MAKKEEEKKEGKMEKTHREIGEERQKAKKKNLIKGE